MRSEIITIGDELLVGQVVNTNQTFIADRLTTCGIFVERMTSVADDLDPILSALSESWARADIVVVTGGLGPTHDDVTKKALCRFFQTDLVTNMELREAIERLLRKRNIGWTQAAEEQTMVPRKAKLIPNPVGTAAGMIFTEELRHCIVLPGVPYEMEAMMDATVIPFVKALVQESKVMHRTLQTTGIAESTLAAALGDLTEILQGARLAFLPSPRGVRLRITVTGSDEAAGEDKLNDVENRIRSKAGKYVYGTGDVEIEQVIGELLTSHRLTLAVAESCTGGLIADRITNVSGSSAYFKLGIVAYSNVSKTQLLGVSELLLEHHGAVSREVAEAMAVGVRRQAGSDIGISTTGIAGPTGGIPEKPIGLVWIAYADAINTVALRFNFGEDRRRVKERASQAALELVRRKLLKMN